jgi:hypothetical protein
LSGAVVLEAVKVWPGKGEACRKVGATANLDSFCAHRRQLCAGRDEETDFEDQIKKQTKKKRCAVLANSLTKKAPYKGLGADSEEKHEPVGDIDTVVVDSLKALDLERPIREADIREWASICPLSARLGYWHDGSRSIAPYGIVVPSDPG